MIGDLPHSFTTVPVSYPLGVILVKSLLGLSITLEAQTELKPEALALGQPRFVQ